MDNGGFITLVGVLIALAIGFLGARQKGLSDLVSALQAEVRSLREASTEDRSRIETLEASDRVKDDYIHELRDHITEQKPPPPPPFPAGY